MNLITRWIKSTWMGQQDRPRPGAFLLHGRGLVPVLLLVVALLACAEKHWVNRRVYALTSGTESQFYDAKTDTILAMDVWVFQPDGTYDALIRVEGQTLALTGTYGGDNAADVFIWRFDTDGDGTYDEHMVENNDGASLVWERETETLTYYLATP